jgi:hypothetical protein
LTTLAALGAAFEVAFGVAFALISRPIRTPDHRD